MFICFISQNLNCKHEYYKIEIAEKQTEWYILWAATMALYCIITALEHFFLKPKQM